VRSRFQPCCGHRQASALYGICAPKSTAVEIIEVLNKEINAGLADPKLKERLAGLGSSVFIGSPSQYGRVIADD
jgi:tripartite-type tricarboxylate transporter receptor subunit TctC